MPLRDLELAVLAEDLVALPAFEWHVWEIIAHDTLDLLNQLLLQLVLDFVFLDIDLWDRFRPHQFVDDSIWEHQVKLVVVETLNLLIWVWLAERIITGNHNIYLLLLWRMLSIQVLWLLHLLCWCAVLILLQLILL